MATQKIVGPGAFIPPMPAIGMGPSFATSLLIDANGEKAAFVGRVYAKDPGQKNLTKIGFRFGAVSVGATTDLQVSCQDLNATDAYPDEVADQTVLVGNANITAATWREVTLGAARVVNVGTSILAVVFEYSTFNASDSVEVSSIVSNGAPGMWNQSYCALKAGAGPTWSVVGNVPNLILGFDDNTYGTLWGALGWSAINNLTVNTGTNPDEVALVAQFPFPCTCDGAWTVLDLDGDCDVILYDGTTAVTGCTISADKDNRVATSARLHSVPWAAHAALTKSTDYRLAVKPTTATSVTAYSVDVANADYWQAMPGGPQFAYSSRVDGGAWAATTATRRLVAGLSINGADDGVSSTPLKGEGF